MIYKNVRSVTHFQIILCMSKLCIKRPQDEVLLSIFEKDIAKKVQTSKLFLNYK